LRTSAVNCGKPGELSLLSKIVVSFIDPVGYGRLLAVAAIGSCDSQCKGLKSRNYTYVVTGRQGMFITGISIGGMGSLRIAFKHPDLFQGVASQEPGIEPALAFDDIKLLDRYWLSDELFQQIYGKPIDKAYWTDNNPATIASRAPDRLLGFDIYLSRRSGYVLS